MLRIKYFATMHGNFFNITLKNVHNIKATHGNTPSPFGGEGEGSFDINIGTKKQSLSVQDAIFLSISIVCFSRISSVSSSSSIFFILPGSNTSPSSLSASSLACQLPHHLSYPPPSIRLSHLHKSLVAPPFSITLHG